jgi:hypothetical protein
MMASLAGGQYSCIWLACVINDHLQVLVDYSAAIIGTVKIT